MIGKSMARGDDESTPSAGAEAEGRSVGTRGWFIISECHWLTIIGELRSLWFTIIFSFCNPKREKFPEIFWPIFDFAANCDTFYFNWQSKVEDAASLKGRENWMKLEKLGVITKAGKPLEWSSALHLEPKADNDLRDRPGLQWVTFDSGTIEETKYPPQWEIFLYLLLSFNYW